jgi:hypothetical protein
VYQGFATRPARGDILSLSLSHAEIHLTADSARL